MNYVTLGQLSNFMWYIQKIQVKDLIVTII